MKSESWQALDNIISLGWAAALKLDGYRRQGRSWYQRSEGIVRVVNIQSSSLNLYGMGRFTLNFGVYFDAVARATDKELSRPIPKVHDCQVRRRIGQLLPSATDKWWEFDQHSDLKEIADELVEAWRRYGKPWLERLSDIHVARDEAILQKNYWLATQISATLGETQAVRHWLGQVLIEYPNRNHAYFLDWAERRGITLPKIGSAGG